MWAFDNIHERLKVRSDDLIGKEVYMMVDGNALSINDLILVTIKEIITEDRDEHGIIIIGEHRIINKDLEEEITLHKGHAIYLVVGENKVMTSDGPKIVVSSYDDYGPFIEMIPKNDTIGKYFINAVFRYKGVFFYFKVSGNYLFKTEQDAIDYINALDVLEAYLTDRGMVVNIFGDDFLVEKFVAAVSKNKYREPWHKKIILDKIKEDNSNMKKIKLNFKRYVIKYL